VLETIKSTESDVEPMCTGDEANIVQLHDVAKVASSIDGAQRGSGDARQSYLLPPFVSVQHEYLSYVSRHFINP
jgi:hypothetical protein